MEILGIQFNKYKDHYLAYFGTIHIGYRCDGEDKHAMWFGYTDVPMGSASTRGEQLFSSKEEGLTKMFAALTDRMNVQLNRVEGTYLTVTKNLKSLKDAINSSEQLKSQLDIKDILE